jgi:hypothetical protein
MSVEGLGFPRVKKIVVPSIAVHLFVVFRGRETGEPNGVEIPFRIGRVRIAKVSVQSNQTQADCSG